MFLLMVKGFLFEINLLNRKNIYFSVFDLLISQGEICQLPLKRKLCSIFTNKNINNEDKLSSENPSPSLTGLFVTKCFFNPVQFGVLHNKFSIMLVHDSLNRPIIKLKKVNVLQSIFSLLIWRLDIPIEQSGCWDVYIFE